jgi:hypothetical protein
MSCDDIEGTEVLVYVRRAIGGGTGGVTYKWDYYQMASLPTNDNVRYRTVKLRDKDSPTIPLHEIGNNRYEDMVCKSTHLAYKVGAFNRSAVISPGEAKNPVDKLKESSTNKCVLLMTSSNNFYQRLPECWPWSCRRWTIDITDNKDEQGKVISYTYKVFKQDINGYKVEVNNFTIPVNHTDYQIINILINDSSKLPRFALETQSSSGVGNFYSLTTRPVFKVGINKTASHPESIAMDGSFYEETQVATASFKDGQYTLTDDEADVTQCPKSSQKVFLAFELFPVLCDGTCKLIVRLGYKCVDKDNGSSGGRQVQKNISPFWSCRINETIEMFNEDEENRPLLNLAKVTLDGTETRSLESFTENGEQLAVITGADYYYDDNNIRKMYNLADGEVEKSYYNWKGGGNFGKAQEYLAAQSTCCKYCKKVDPITKVATYYPNVYCTALDTACDGRGYADYKEPCL